MRKQLPYLALILFSTGCSDTMSYEQSIAIYQSEYKKGFIIDDRAPLEAEDTSFIRFFPINKNYKVSAEVQPTPEAVAFDIPTANGKTKKYRQFGVVKFTINDTLVSLQVYQSLKLIEQEEYKDHLFLPFTDATTYTTTYGGGRYLDLSQKDIIDNQIILDFNKCYNPWCAFASGYSCPIPPKENRISVAIAAGEMKFGKEIAH